MEIRYLLNVMRAHLGFIITATLVAGAVAVLATYVLPEKYDASTVILIRPRQEPNFAPTAEMKATLDYPVSFSIPPETVSLTYANIMTSAAVATRVVEILGLHRPPPSADAPFYKRLYRSLRNAVRWTVSVAWDLARFGRVEKKDPYWKAVEDVTKALDASPVEDTYLFKLTATWDDPHIAARIADTAAQVFVEYTLDARRTEESASVVAMTGRLERLREELGAARDRLRDFEFQSQASAPAKRVELKLGALTEFEALRAEVRRQLASADARVGSLGEMVETEPVDVNSGRTLARNDLLMELRGKLAEDETKLAGLEQVMTPAHPEAKAIRARIEAATRRIADEQEMVRLRDESSKNPVREELRKNLLDGRATRASLQAAAREIDGAIARYRQDVDELVNRKSEQERRALEVEVLEEEYKLVSREHAEARLAAAQELSEIRTLAPAIPPVYPKKPIKVLYGAIGLFAGLLASLALVLAFDYVEPRVRSGEDVRRLMGVPVVVTLPGVPRELRSGHLLADGTSSSIELWRLLTAQSGKAEGRE